MQNHIIKFLKPIIFVIFLFLVWRIFPQIIKGSIDDVGNAIHRARCTVEITQDDLGFELNVNGNSLTSTFVVSTGGGLYDSQRVTKNGNTYKILLHDIDNMAFKSLLKEKRICTISNIKPGNYKLEVIDDNGFSQLGIIYEVDFVIE